MAATSTNPATNPAPVTAPSATKARDPWFDNAKMALVLLVVVGHAWTLLPFNAVTSHLYDFLYAWHVPAFVFVTGYLSRSFSYTSRRMRQLVTTVVVPYVIFECAIALFRIYVGGEKLEDLFRDPHWPMWYLAALFFWRLATPVFTAMRGRYAVPLAIAISLVAGMYAGDTLDLARVCGLLPFFVLGLHATQDNLERLRTHRVRTAAVLVFLGIAVLSHWTEELASTEWLYYRSQYGDLDVSDTRAFVTRGALLVIGFLGAMAFYALVPRVGGWFTRLGAATLVVYLFHGFVVKGLEYSGYMGWAEDHYPIALVVTTLGAAALAMLLAWPPVAKVLNHAVDPFAYAEKHVSHGLALAHVPAHADQIAVAIEEAVAEDQSTDERATEEPAATTR